jgi:hypothetical protein
MTKSTPFAFTASNGYRVEICEYKSAKVISPAGEHVGGFSGPSAVWAARHDRRDHTNWAGTHASFSQTGTRLNVGSAKAEHAEAVIAAVREQHDHNPEREVFTPTDEEIAKVRAALAARGIDLDELMAE